MTFILTYFQMTVSVSMVTVRKTRVGIMFVSVMKITKDFNVKKNWKV